MHWVTLFALCRASNLLFSGQQGSNSAEWPVKASKWVFGSLQLVNMAIEQMLQPSQHSV